jgi:sulfite exporter TauE/SafE
MNYWIFSALIMGFLGSAHCVGMCGPLALSLPIHHEKPINKLFQTLLYNLGRATTYAVFGSLVGIAHQWLIPEFVQNTLSLLMGATLLALGLYYFLAKRQTINVQAFSRWNQRISHLLGRLYQQNGTGTSFAIGALNGLLPCGLVYLALATAFSSARVVDSTLFMFFFGLGTLPAMWSITFLAHWFSPTNRSTLRRLVPWVYALTGLLLVMRGLGHHNPLQHYMPHQYCSK